MKSTIRNGLEYLDTHPDQFVFYSCVILAIIAWRFT